MRVSERAGDREKEKGGGGCSETGTVRRAALSDRQEPGQTLTHTHTDQQAHRQTYNHTCTLAQANMHVDTALYVRSHPDGHKQSSPTRTGPLVNDIQNQKVSAAERRGMRIPVERGTGYERKTQECIDDVLGASSDTCFLLLGDSKQAHAFFQDI